MMHARDIDLLGRAHLQQLRAPFVLHLLCTAQRPEQCPAYVCTTAQLGTLRVCPAGAPAAALRTLMLLWGMQGSSVHTQLSVTSRDHHQGWQHVRKRPCIYMQQSGKAGC